MFSLSKGKEGWIETGTIRVRKGCRLGIHVHTLFHPSSRDPRETVVVKRKDQEIKRDPAAISRKWNKKTHRQA